MFFLEFNKYFLEMTLSSQYIKGKNFDIIRVQKLILFKISVKRMKILASGQKKIFANYIQDDMKNIADFCLQKCIMHNKFTQINWAVFKEIFSVNNHRNMIQVPQNDTKII